MRGELSRIENLAVVRHLLTRCPQCVAVARQLWALRDRPRSLRLVREGAPAKEPCPTGRRTTG